MTSTFRTLAVAALIGSGASTATADPAADAPLDNPLTCLAKTVYFEARGQSEREMLAVAHVVTNRVEDPQFPETMCGVIKEGGPKPPCQFSWWCDGRPDVARDEVEFGQAIEVAQAVLAGETEDPTDGANMFHNGRVKPRWTSAAEGRGRIGDQLFYYLEDR